MICQNCNSEVVPGSAFCHSCGSKIVLQTNKFCVSCGSKINNNDHFCPSCGNAVNGGSNTQAVQHQKPMSTIYNNQTQTTYTNPRHPSEYLNLRRIRTWSGINILFSLPLGIWSYSLVKKIENAPNETIARKLYKKAKRICVAGSIVGMIVLIIYSNMQ